MSKSEIKKLVTFEIFESYMTCDNCRHCYDGLTDQPTFCQTFSFGVNEHNNKRGLTCDYWLPKGIDASKITTVKERPAAWYEKDSMG